jgi:hypothetical protein
LHNVVKRNTILIVDLRYPIVILYGFVDGAIFPL